MKHIIIAGTFKAGTSTLFKALSMHPDISASRVKETGYFIQGLFNQKKPTRAEYLHLFFNSDISEKKYYLEASPGYFAYSNYTSDIILAEMPDSKIIIILRNPYDRLCSFYEYVKTNYRFRNGVIFTQEDEDNFSSLEKYISACRRSNSNKTSLTEELNYLYGGISQSLYYNNLKTWLEKFNPANIKVIIFENYINDEPSTLKAVLTWLNLSHHDACLYVKPSNVTQRYKSPLLQGIAIKINQSFEPFFRSHPKIKDCVKNAYWAINAHQDDNDTKESILKIT